MAPVHPPTWANTQHTSLDRGNEQERGSGECRSNYGGDGEVVNGRRGASGSDSSQACSEEVMCGGDNGGDDNWGLGVIEVILIVMVEM